MAFAQNDASRPTEAPLRKIIADLQQGAPDTGSMEPELGSAVQAQAAAIAGLLQSLGRVQQLEFTGTENGTDVYKVTFERGAASWRILMAPTGKIAGLLFKPVAAPETRGDDVAMDGLSGTLLKPRDVEHPPVVLLIGGSGPTDRNGNQGGTGPGELRQLAEQLAEKGIASLRYDKRAVGRSAVAGLREKDFVLNSFVDDAVTWLDWLRRRPDLGPRIIAGHSEGGVIALLAAKRTSVAGIVLLATPGRKLGDVIREQLQGFRMDAALQSEASTILATLERGELVPNVSPALHALFRPSIQRYMISELAIDPVTEIKTLTLPVMIVSGGHDLQISSADADALSAERPDAICLTISGMNHVLKMAPADRASQQDAYSNPNLPLAPGLSDAIANFVQQAAR
ncbi:alpha/beta fold hydrolase [Bradyrhizobium sp. WYCCWR 13023]|uniref:Alpha/beta fold hydrolase n=1 Tax=Bradyrhizobium zhengyangense TaxID=2911009 RepID=A0A9X1U895_9BRAD|nr:MULTISPECIES: alpha/beta fold hydrolase [Bradyrhizobium]MCG2626174.1 alpha/beta fold hydrolase [Bradyrhizobium zhengyangense]